MSNAELTNWGSAPTSPVHDKRPDGKGLATGTLGLAGSTVIGLASTAPLYSLAATLGYVVIEVGAQAPIAFILAFVPMLLVAFAYRELNRDVPDCGTTFTWGVKAFNPWVGWMGGWGVAVAGVVVLASLVQVGGKYLWLLIDEGAGTSFADNTWLVMGTGVVFILAMSWISYRGLEIGERMQNVLIAIQYLAMAMFVGFVIWKFATGDTPAEHTTPAWDWFNPFAFSSTHGMVEAILLCLFIYWGWDTCLALNEETKDPTRIPGRAAVLTCTILLVTYVGVTVAAMCYMGLGETGMGLGNETNADDLFYAVKDALMGPWAWFLVLAVMISAISSTQTTILPTARGTLAMAVYKALPARFATVHPRFKTPSFSTAVMATVAIGFYVLMTVFSENALQDTILSLGLAIAFYYSITSFACVWYYKDSLFTSRYNFFNKFLWPLLGGVMLAAVFIYSAFDMWNIDYGYTVVTIAGHEVGGVFIIGVGSLILGVILMLAWAATTTSRPFFRGESLNRNTEVLVPDE